MFELVPSLYMRSLFEDLNYELSDFNKATIIWNMFPESKEILTQEYEGDPVASVHYTSEGVIQRMWSNEMPEEDRVDSYRRERFEFQFINIPFEGTRGFQVKDIRDGSIGVLMSYRKAGLNLLIVLSRKSVNILQLHVSCRKKGLVLQGLWMSR